MSNSPFYYKTNYGYVPVKYLTRDDDAFLFKRIGSPTQSATFIIEKENLKNNIFKTLPPNANIITNIPKSKLHVNTSNIQTSSLQSPPIRSSLQPPPIRSSLQPPPIRSSLSPPPMRPSLQPHPIHSPLQPPPIHPSFPIQKKKGIVSGYNLFTSAKMKEGYKFKDIATLWKNSTEQTRKKYNDMAKQGKQSSPKKASPKLSPKKASPKLSPKKASPKLSPKKASPKLSPKKASPNSSKVTGYQIYQRVQIQKGKHGTDIINTWNSLSDKTKNKYKLAADDVNYGKKKFR